VLDIAARPAIVFHHDQEGRFIARSGHPPSRRKSKFLFIGRRWSMKKAKMRTFRSRLREDLKDPEFKTHYQEERQALKLAMKIAKLREKKGLSQQQMAKLMGTSQQAISRIESGEYEGFTLKTLEKIAEATGTKVKIEFVAA
jgi:DNA-binding XRE family transcriptional regulator